MAMLRLQHNFNTVIFFISKDVVAVWSIFELHSVGDDERRIDRALFDIVEERLQVSVHVGLPHFEGQPFGECGSEGNHVQQATVDAGEGDRAALPARLNRLAQSNWSIRSQMRLVLDRIHYCEHVGSMSLQAHRINTRV